MTWHNFRLYVTIIFCHDFKNVMNEYSDKRQFCSKFWLYLVFRTCRSYVLLFGGGGYFSLEFLIISLLVLTWMHELLGIKQHVLVSLETDTLRYYLIQSECKPLLKPKLEIVDIHPVHTQHCIGRLKSFTVKNN